MKKMMMMLGEAPELALKGCKHLISRKGSCQHIQIRKEIAKKKKKNPRQPVEYSVTGTESNVFSEGLSQGY